MNSQETTAKGRPKSTPPTAPKIGGARPGSGRPTIDPELRKIPRTITLTPELWARAAELGHGNLSAGVALALQAKDAS